MKLKNGTIIPIYVTRVMIDASEPCKKETCMVSLTTILALQSMFGQGNYYVKSTSAGVKFTHDGYRYTCVFPPSTAKKIFHYDQMYRRTSNKALTRATVRPFKTKLMVLESAKLAPPASPEERQRRNESQNRIYHERKAAGLPYARYSGQREISL